MITIVSVVYPEVDEWSIVQSDLCHSAPVSRRLRFAGWNSWHHANALGQDMLQFRRSAARYQRPYQRHRVLVEIRL